MPERKEIELFVILDSNGDYGVGADLETAETDFNENIGGEQARRIIRVVLHATVPEEMETTHVEAPDSAETLPTATASDA